MHPLKSIIANFLLILFISTQAAFMVNHACLIHHRQTEKKSTKQNIWLTFTTEEWKQVEKIHEDEVRIQGRMFDIKSVEFENDKVIVYGHYDTKEDKLIAKAKDDKKKGEQKKNTGTDNPLFFEEQQMEASKFVHFFQKKDYPLLKQNYFFQFYTIENPPPRMIA